MAGIYVHIPFCKKKCSYCDFHFSTTFSAYRQQMINALCTEIDLKLSRLDVHEKIESLYFGGGTPSLLLDFEWLKLKETLSKYFDINKLLEFTIETNPDDINEEHLNFWKILGVNRLSIGVQSFRDEDLVWMNRAHNSNEALACIQLAQRAGFNKLTIDLMYGLPNQSLAVWKEQLKIATDLGVTHISSYCLTVEERTALCKKVQDGELVIPDDELIAEQFDFMVSWLETYGFLHYEISNFSQPDCFALHNANYWKGVPYMGIGPSAHSFDGENRSWNISNNAQYIKAIELGQIPENREELTPENRFNEIILTGLRTIWGVDYKALTKTGHVTEHFTQQLLQMEADGDIIWQDGHFKLTKKAKLRADYIAARLFF
jgi:oxygen-independent coproporphyrinogen-3 oxidase